MAEWCGSHSSRWDGSNCHEKGLFARVLPAFCDSVADIKLVVRDVAEGAGMQRIWLRKMFFFISFLRLWPLSVRVRQIIILFTDIF